MAKIAGRFQSITIDGITVNGIVDATMNLENAILDTTAHDDLDSRTFIYGRQTGTVDLTLRWDDADPGQEDLLDAAFGKTVNTYVFTMETLSGADRYTFSGLVSTSSPSAPNDDVAELSAAIQITGDITRDTQP